MQTLSSPATLYLESELVVPHEAKDFLVLSNGFELSKNFLGADKGCERIPKLHVIQGESRNRGFRGSGDRYRLVGSPPRMVFS